VWHLRGLSVIASSGGSLYAHRHRSGTSFAHPSVHCADLKKLIIHTRDRLLPQRVANGHLMQYRVLAARHEAA